MAIDESSDIKLVFLLNHLAVHTCLNTDFDHTVKPVLSGHSKIDKTILMTNGSLMKVECIVAFCNTFDLH